MARLAARLIASQGSILLITTLACAGVTSGSRSDLRRAGEQLITEEQIVESGATTAWEAIKRNAPQVQLFERKNGEAIRIVRRGRGSIYLNDGPVVFLDGVRMSDFRNLQLVPATTILSIVIITGIDGTTYYGTNAAGGVILIDTKRD
jgi:outer membrane receptor protein involved in Fe transport